MSQPTRSNQTDTLPIEIALEALAAQVNNRMKVKNQWYCNKDVPLDGYEFEKCRFDQCRLIIQRGDFVLNECFVADSNKLVICDDSEKIISLFLYHLGRAIPLIKSFTMHSHFNIQENIDGTISIPWIIK